MISSTFKTRSKAAAAAKDGWNGCTAEEILASHVYAKFAKNGVSKAIAAQYLAGRLQRKQEEGKLTPDELRARLPTYLTDAIDYVTNAGDLAKAPPNQEATAHE